MSAVKLTTAVAAYLGDLCAASGRAEARRASVATGRRLLAPRLLQSLAKCAGLRGGCAIGGRESG